MDEEKFSVYKTPEEIEEQEKQKEPTPEEMKETIRRLRLKGEPLPGWLLLKKTVTVGLIGCVLFLFYTFYTVPLGIKMIAFIPLSLALFIFIDYLKLIGRMKKMIKET